MTEQIHSFSDFAKEEQALEGDKVKIESILNKEIVITRYKIRDSKYSDNNKMCVAVQFYQENGEKAPEKKIFFTGSSVIQDLLVKYEENLPFKTTIKKIDRYFTFT